MIGVQKRVNEENLSATKIASEGNLPKGPQCLTKVEIRIWKLSSGKGGDNLFPVAQDFYSANLQPKQSKTGDLEIKPLQNQASSILLETRTKKKEEIASQTRRHLHENSPHLEGFVQGEAKAQ